MNKMNELNAFAGVTVDGFKHLRKFGVIAVSMESDGVVEIQMTAEGISSLGVDVEIEEMAYKSELYEVTAHFDSFRLFAVADEEERQKLFADKGVVA
ncbi:hypothetical protein [Salicibibacter kimchii]|uniref:Uncharacterized protein n=1 Tax=Salicibibacter kimchii TaxID=2099786 RepID=A0A345BUG1_9BACI|nr:hypothetical protein [Salicibibacter kimchii]AXF54592.1 hypothetical protein DT065_00215 [Salicibibacter kimchii]